MFNSSPLATLDASGHVSQYEFAVTSLARMIWLVITVVVSLWLAYRGPIWIVSTLVDLYAHQ
jgi:hypothetical protein